MLVTKIFTFDAAHYLPEYNGACANLHGHTYRLEVSYWGLPDEDGFLRDFKDMKRDVQAVILDKLDHAYLNDVLGFKTTAENMAVWMLKELKKVDCGYRKIRLYETPTSYVDVDTNDLEYS